MQSYNLYGFGLSETNDYALRGYARIEIKADSSFSLYHIRYNDIDHPILMIDNGIAK